MKTRILTSVFALLLAAPFLGCAHSGAGPTPAYKPVPSKAFTVKVVGHGPPVILVPGLATSGEVWNGTVAHLSSHFTCHVLSLAGFAGVWEVDGPFIATERKAIAGYIQAQHLDHPVIIGQGTGGAIALDLAARHPDQVGKLVLVDVLPYPPAAGDSTVVPNEELRDKASELQQQVVTASLPTRRRFARRTLSMEISDPKKIDLAVKWAMDSSRITTGTAMYERMTTDFRPDVPKIQCPTLLVASSVGAPLPNNATMSDVFDTQYAGLRSGKLVVAPNARAFVMWDQPDWFYQQLDQFLGQPASTPAAGATPAKPSSK